MQRNYDDYVQRLDKIKRTAPDGSEYWFARELQSILSYYEWRNFEAVMNKAKSSCESAGADLKNHFVETNKMITTSSM